MLARKLEPEVMDSAAEARDYDAMDHGDVNRAFVRDFVAAWDGKNPILDVGTGTALIPIELCRQHPGAQVLGIDLTDNMLRLGRDNIHRAGLDERIRLERWDAKHLPCTEASFSGVISNSIVHHIAEPVRVLAEMGRVAVPGGVLFVRDLLRPDDEDTLRRLVAQHTAGGNAHQQQMFADSLHAALTLDEIRELVSRLGFDPSSVSQTSDRHWTWQARKELSHKTQQSP